MISRRTLLVGSAAGLLAGCDKLSNSERFRNVLRSAEGLTMKAQRLISDRQALAREFGAADISPIFRSNGTRMPAGEDYARLAAGAFADWRLAVDGLV
ncbi:MAG: molybdopterin-binding protein, partial [Sphingomonadaceae bacterium]|nr:molybdopterin-binding protein [Sphingomonadaceae bacterium]